MQDFAKAFYLSKAWRDTRAFVFERDFGLCRRCGAPGEIVHHIKYLTPENINNPAIALNPDNLETLCRVCHALEHEGNLPTDADLQFDECGYLVRKELRS